MTAVQIDPKQSLVNVTFRNHTVQDEQASKQAGRPIFIDHEVCDITFPANPKTKATFPAHDPEPNATRESVKDGGPEVTYAELYNKQYLAFKEGTVQPTSGTPLTEAPFLTEAKRRELRALHVHTVEQLASLDGNPLKQLGMGGRELKNQAQAYLDKAAGSADVTNLAAQVAALTAQLAEERKLREEMLKGAKLDRVAELDDGLDPVAHPDDNDDFEPATAPSAEAIEAMDDDALKNYIASETGSRPRGNPSHATLLAAAKELAMVA